VVSCRYKVDGTISGEKGAHYLVGFGQVRRKKEREQRGDRRGKEEPVQRKGVTRGDWGGVSHTLTPASRLMLRKEKRGEGKVGVVNQDLKSWENVALIRKSEILMTIHSTSWDPIK